MPTEVEWEKAGCGGLEGLRYPWRGAINEHLANYNYVIGKPTPVGNYEPNGYGLYDVIGNVAEWCADVYDTIRVSLREDGELCAEGVGLTMCRL